MSNNQFEFRSKFKKILNDSNEAIITAAFESFMLKSDAEARNLLWDLTYGKESVENASKELGITNCEILGDKVILLRNELRTQFEKNNPNFLKPDVPPIAYDAYESLVKQADNDTILANVVYYKCYRVVFESSYIRNRVLFLLNSEDDKNNFGGLRQMGFNYYESEYLKPFHLHIRALLEKLCAQEKKGEFDPEFFNAIEDEWYEEETVPVVENEEIESSVQGGIVTKKLYQNEEEISEDVDAEVSEDVEEEISEEESEEGSEEGSEEKSEENVGEDISAKAEAETTEASEMAGEDSSTIEETDVKEIVATVKYKELLPSAILNEKEAFQGFVENSEDLNTLVAIGQLGYDLNQVVAKKELIVKLVNASNAFAMIYKTLEQAEKYLNDVIIQFLKS